MSSLVESLDAYLALRRGLGVELRAPGAHLQRFVAFLDRESAAVITRELALRWATSPTNATPATWAERLGHVRRFAAWLSATDPRTEVPPKGLLTGRYRRRPPYIYSDAEIESIVHQAALLPSVLGMRGHSYATLFGLLAATGMRINEALALERDDVDLRSGVLAIRRAKFGKSRFVPLQETTCAALHFYAQHRDRLVPHPSSTAFLISDRGRRLKQCSARYNFAVVSRAVGLRAAKPGRKHGRGPRLHDMRHRLAVKTLIRWYREGLDVERELPKLSTYLGHVHVADTYWYIEAVPELLQLATERATGSRKGAP